MKQSILFLCLFFLSTNLSAQGRLDTKQKELKKIKRKISLTTTKLKKKRQEEKTTLKKLQILQIKLKDLTKKRNRLTHSSRIAEREAEKIQMKRKELRTELEEVKQNLGLKLLMIYQWNRVCIFKDSICPPIIGSLHQVANYDYQLIETHKTALDRLASVQKERDKNIIRIKNLQKKIAALQYKISIERRKEQRMLQQIKRDKAAHLRTVRRLKTSASQLEQLIKRLKAKSVTSRSRIIKGKLDWPIGGKIIVPFGRYWDKDASTYLFNSGIEIRAPYGESFKAVARGKVIYADWLKGYGNLIILDHGGGYYTLYAHAISLYKSAGEWVKKGEVLGTVGDIGSLYFELRCHDKPINPFTWLKSDKIK